MYDGQQDATDNNNDNLTEPEDDNWKHESIPETNNNQPNTPEPNNTTEQTIVEQHQTTDPDETLIPTDVLLFYFYFIYYLFKVDKFT